MLNLTYMGLWEGALIAGTATPVVIELQQEAVSIQLVVFDRTGISLGVIGGISLGSGSGNANSPDLGEVNVVPVASMSPDKTLNRSPHLQRMNGGAFKDISFSIGHAAAVGGESLSIWANVKFADGSSARVNCACPAQNDAERIAQALPNRG